MSNSLLDGYEPVKNVGGSGKKTPIVEIAKSGEGAYLKGVLLSTRTHKDQEGKERLIASFKLIETTAKAVAKTSAGYAPVNVASGEEVSVFGPPASLERAIKSVNADGSVEMLIVYEGKKKVKLGNGKSVNMHTFKIGKRAVATVKTEDEVPD